MQEQFLSCFIYFFLFVLYMNQKKIMFLVASAVCVLCLSFIVSGGAGYYFYQDDQKQKNKAKLAKLAAVSTTTPSPVSTTTDSVTSLSPKSGMDGPDSIFLCSNGISNGTFKYGVWDRPGFPDKYDTYELSPGLKRITPPEGTYLDSIPGNLDNNFDIRKQYTVTFTCSPVLLEDPSKVIKSKISSFPASDSSSTATPDSASISTTTPTPIVTPSPKSGTDGPDSIFLCSNGISNGTFKYGVWDKPGLPDKYDTYELSPGLKSIAPPEGTYLDSIPGNSDNNFGIRKQYTVTFTCSPTLLPVPLKIIKSKISTFPASSSTSTPEGGLIINRGSGKCLNVHYGVKENGTELNFFDCQEHNRADQTWVYSNNRIRLGNSNYCVDVASGDGSDKAKVHLWECSDTNNNQKFTNEHASFKWWGADGQQKSDRWLYNHNGKLVVTSWLPDSLFDIAPFQRFQSA